jgi:hypothetical protein
MDFTNEFVKNIKSYWWLYLGIFLLSTVINFIVLTITRRKDKK